MTVKATVVFCDDIRIEQNGKLMIIGVYSDELVPAFLPQHLGIAVWIKLENLPQGRHNIRFQSGFNGSIGQDMIMPIDVAEGKDKANMLLNGIPFSLTQPGEVFIKLSGFPDGSVVEETLRVTEVKPQEEMRYGA